MDISTFAIMVYIHMKLLAIGNTDYANCSQIIIFRIGCRVISIMMTRILQNGLEDGVCQRGVVCDQLWKKYELEVLDFLNSYI